MLYSAILAYRKYVCLSHAEKFTKISYFGGSRSFNVLDVGTLGKLVSAVLVTISSKSVCICNYSHVRLVDRSRNSAFEEGTQI